MLTLAFKRFSRACKPPCSHNLVRHHRGFTYGVLVSFELMVYREYLKISDLTNKRMKSIPFVSQISLPSLMSTLSVDYFCHFRFQPCSGIMWFHGSDCKPLLTPLSKSQLMLLSTKQGAFQENLPARSAFNEIIENYISL